MRIFVIIRVHQRTEDLKIAVAVMRRLWTCHEYAVLVVSNGRNEGFPVPDVVRESGIEVIELPGNAGHLRGNSQMLQAGLNRLPPDAQYVVLLEADTWLLSDRLVDEAIRRMEHQGAVWAGAAWLDRYHSLALDFAVVQAAFLREHPGLLEFELHPETHVASYLRRHRAGYVLLPELMPVHIPRILRGLVRAPGGRFSCFPDGPMVTHHLEDLPGGLEQKLAEANYTLGIPEFDVAMDRNPAVECRRRRAIARLARLSPRSAWVRRRQDRDH